jgi:protein phosphatase
MVDKSEVTTVEYPPVQPDEIRLPRPLSERVRVQFGALSHPGRVRTSNEDHFLVLRAGRSMEMLLNNLPAGMLPDRFHETAYILAVADGVGGSAAGEVASCMALHIGVNLGLNRPKWNLKEDPDEALEAVEVMRQRIRQIDYVLTQLAHAEPALAGMGTTLTVAHILGAELFLYQVGDSRAYLFRRGQLHQLTHDQTMAQALADAGHIAPEDLAHHRLRHVLTNALGGQGGKVEAEARQFRMADGDRLLLCTDGLTDMVADAQIADILGRVAAPEEAAAALVEAALQGGGKDNVTVALARYAILEEAPAE